MVRIVGEEKMTNITKWSGFTNKFIKAFWGEGTDIYQERGKWVLKIPPSRKAPGRGAAAQWVLTKNLLKAMKKAGYRAYTHKKNGKWHFLDVLNTVVWFKHQEKKFCFTLSLRIEKKTDLPHEHGLAWYIIVTPISYESHIKEIPLRWKPRDKGLLGHLFGH